MPHLLLNKANSRTRNRLKKMRPKKPTKSLDAFTIGLTDQHGSLRWKINRDFDMWRCQERVETTAIITIQQALRIQEDVFWNL